MKYKEFFTVFEGLLFGEKTNNGVKSFNKASSLPKMFEELLSELFH